jgi:hypothetical protein
LAGAGAVEGGQAIQVVVVIALVELFIISVFPWTLALNGGIKLQPTSLINDKILTL